MEYKWCVRETPFQPERLNQLETIFTIGNGCMGVRGSFEEGYPGDAPLFLIHGLFNRPDEDSVPELVNVPSWLDLKIAINGATFGLDAGRVLGYERTLDMRRAVLRRHVLWQAPNGPIVRFRFERFASMARRRVLAMRVEITPVDASTTVEIKSRLGKADPTHWTDVLVGHRSPSDAFLRARTRDSGYRLGMETRLLIEPAAQMHAAEDDGWPINSARIAATAGQTITVTKLAAVHTSRDAHDPPAAARQTLDEASAAGYSALYREHIAAWDKLWAHTDVEIEGDDFAQLAIRFALYHLLIAAPRDDERASIGAKALSGPGYKGHVFWDTELFALAPLIYTQPDLARNLLMYRYHLLPGARAKAAENGFEGAMYPWESADTGEETTPRWTTPPPGGHRERIWTGEREIHISADVAYAVDHYWKISGDDNFMAEYGAEIVLDTAVFWGSRAEYNEAEDRFEINHVIGPDEYHEDVNNSAFTNVMAQWNIRAALDVLDWLRRNHPVRAEELSQKLGLGPERLSHWREVAEKMYVPRDGDVLLEFDGFFDLEPVDVEAYRPRIPSLQAIYGTPFVQRSQVIKQADVVMLIALLGEELGPPEMLRANWDVYAPRCDHGSSLSAAIHSLVAARLGLIEQAYELWLMAAGVDLENNKGNTADGIHAAAAGGLWQATVFGFAGLGFADDRPTLDPHLPPHWRKLRFRIKYRGTLHEVTIAENGVKVSSGPAS